MILVIDDEKPMAKALKHKLSAAGFEVAVAHDGEDGIKQVKNSSPDLIITDLIMPEINGFEFLEEIGDGDTPIFVLSNLSQDEDKKRAKELGAEKFFVKSDVQLKEVVDAVEEFLS